MSRTTAAVEPGDVTGKWRTADGDAVVMIYKADGAEYRGKLTWVRDSLDEDGGPAKDTENPDPAKRDRKLVGLVFMTGFTYKDDKERWEDGKIYDAESGKTYSAHMSLAGNDTLKLRGYIGVSLLGRTETWTRVSEGDG